MHKKGASARVSGCAGELYATDPSLSSIEFQSRASFEPAAVAGLARVPRQIASPCPAKTEGFCPSPVELPIVTLIAVGYSN